MRALLALLSVLLISPAALAATYSENFNDGAANGWQVAAGTWAVQSSTYRSSAIGPNDISVYGGVRWATDFNFRVQINNAFHQGGNLAGVVYNYRNANNYYAVKFAPTGQAFLIRVLNGVETVQTAAHEAVGSDVWFSVEVVRNGSLTNVTVNGTSVFTNVTQTGLGAGRIGLVTSFTDARFNTVVVDPGPLFATGFEFNPNNASHGVIAPHVCFQGSEENDAPSGCWQRLAGRDVSTGFAFPIRLWGATDADASRFELLADYPAVDAETVQTYVQNDIREGAGRNGSDALFQIVKKRGEYCCTQNSFVIVPGTQPQSDVYLSYWLKLEATADAQLIGGEEPDPWRALSEFKPQGSGPDGTGQIRYRMQLRITDWTLSGVPRFSIAADHLDPNQCIWDYERSPNQPAVPLGQWFRVEIFWSRHPTNGRYWAAIDGMTLINYEGRTAADDLQPIGKLFPFLAYSGGAVPFRQWVDDLEIWDRFPSTASPHTGPFPVPDLNEGCL